nr:hyalin-like [Lytechinus pictus]
MSVPMIEGESYATVSWTAPTAKDNYDNTVSPEFNEQSVWSNPGNFTEGITSLSYTAEDSAGNKATCMFTISVIDTEEPVIQNCPSSQSVPMETGQNYAKVSWIAPNVTDNSDNVTLTFNEERNLTNPDNFPEGITSLSYTAEDIAGNKATCMFTISVIDTEEPVIQNCPSSQSVPMETGQNYAKVSWIAPNVTDNSDNVTLTFNEERNLTNPDNFPEGITSLSYTAEDIAGNKATCMFTISVIDTEEPVIQNCPSSQSVPMETGQNYAKVSWIAPNVADNSDNVTLTFNEERNLTNPDNFPEGITSLSYTAEDIAGNKATCMFTISVIDTEEPVIQNCPSSQSVPMETGQNYAKVSWIAPNVTDNSDNVTLTFNEERNLTNPDNFPEGITSLSYTAEDIAGNKATCMFTISVIDTEEPVIQNCPSSQSVPMETGQNYAKVSWIAPNVTDNSDNVTLTFNEERNLTNPDNFPEGITSLSYTAEDIAGNKATCMFTISVIDTEEPVIQNCPSSQSVPMETGQNYAKVSWIAPNVTDNSDNVTLTFNEERNLTNPDNFPEGITSLSYTAEDIAGNKATCMFTISVIDTEEPVIQNCPSSQSVPMETGQNYAKVSWIAPNVTDNSDNVTLTFNEERNLTNPDNFPEGITSLSYTAEDIAGNKATCMFTISVIDTEEPVIQNCPSSQSVPMETGQNYAKVSWIAPNVTDNSDNVTLTFNEERNLTNPDNFPEGITSLSYTAEDIAGNKATCMFTISVIDTEEPVIQNCPSSHSVPMEAGQNYAKVSWIAPNVTDNSDNVTLTFNEKGDWNNPDNFPEGITSLSYTAEDIAGNKATCMFTISVIDNEEPVINNCPLTQSVSTDPGQDFATVSWDEPTVMDNLDQNINLTFTGNETNGGNFPLGITSLSYKSIDAHENVATCMFSIVVSDNEEPVIDDCPSSVTVQTNNGQSYSTVSWTSPKAIDNANDVTLTFNEVDRWSNPGNFTEGRTHLSYTAEDAAGNKATCMFTIAVIEKEEPVIHNCPPAISVPMETGQNYATVSWNEPTATDNSNNVILTFSEAGAWNNPDNFSVGITSLSYVAEDFSSNKATCMFTISVNDNEEPVINDCPLTQSVSTDPGQDFATVSWDEPTVMDNLDQNINLTFNGNGTNGGNFPLGITSLSYRAIDAHENVATCMFSIVVSDNEEPVIDDCPSSVTVQTNNGQSYSTVSWTSPKAIDNANDVTLTFNEVDRWSNPGNFTEGRTHLSYTAEDAAGNKATCMFTIAVIDKEEPVIHNCPPAISVPMETGQNYATVSWNEPTATDNSNNVILTFSEAGAWNNPDNFSVGITSLSYVAEDFSSNKATCMFTISVNDNEEPVIQNCPSSQCVPMETGQNYAKVSWIAPHVTDNSDNVTLTFNEEGDWNNPDNFPEGIASLSYTAGDIAGNKATCMFTISVIDNEEPVINDCPLTQSVSTDPGQDFATVSWDEPTVMDNLDQNINLTFNGNGTNGGNFPLGITSLSYRAIDAHENVATCMFSIVVNDNEAPVITNCPSAQTKTSEVGAETATVHWPEPIESDNSGNVTLDLSHNSGDSFSIGQTVVTYTARDLSGNMATCTFVILVTAPPGCVNDGECGEAETCVQRECQCATGFIRLNGANSSCTAVSMYTVQVTALAENNVEYQFSAELNDPNSPEFQEVANAFIVVMMENTQNIYDIQVNQIMSGSLIFLADVTTGPSTTMSQLEQDIQNAIQTGSATAGPTTIFFVPNDTVISDINECASSTTNDCSPNADCTNMDGSYTCTCHYGHTDSSPAGVGPGRVCEFTSAGSVLGVGGLVGLAVGACVLVVIFFFCCLIAMRRTNYKEEALKRDDPVRLSSFRPRREGDVFRHNSDKGNFFRPYIAPGNSRSEYM